MRASLLAVFGVKSPREMSGESELVVEWTSAGRIVKLGLENHKF